MLKSPELPSNEALESGLMGATVIRYFMPGNAMSFEATVNQAFRDDPDAHLVQLDSYRILDATATEAVRNEEESNKKG